MNDPKGIFGWYDSAEQAAAAPSYDPPHDAPCLICGEAIHALDVRTISLYRPGDQRAYFYRLHRSCHSRASREERDAIDGVIWDAIDGRPA